jgi:hypothetical protein
MTTLRKLFASKRIERVDLLKMDIEGYEYEAVLGSKEVFSARKVNRIALELHPELLSRRGKNAGEITDFLTSCGYRRLSKFDNLVFEIDHQ